MIKACNGFVKGWAEYLCRHKEKDPDDVVLQKLEQVFESIRGLYLDRIDVRKAFRPGLFSILLNGMRYFASTLSFNTLLKECPEFAIDWAMALTSGLGSLVAPQAGQERERLVPSFCSHMPYIEERERGRYLWFRRWRWDGMGLELCCKDCAALQDWDGWQPQGPTS